jgi:hypothetical protein
MLLWLYVSVECALYLFKQCSSVDDGVKTPPDRNAEWRICFD